jgi:hypothetical protein
VVYILSQKELLSLLLSLTKVLQVSADKKEFMNNPRVVLILTVVMPQDAL